MKPLLVLTAAGVLAASFSAPVLAHSGAPGHLHVAPAPAPLVVTPLFPKRPPWAHRIDPSVLHPIPRPVPPFPGPFCLSCPPMPLDQGALTGPVLR